MPNLRTNVIKRPYTFAVTYSDGSAGEITVEAESPSAAALLLPLGICEYTLIEEETA